MRLPRRSRRRIVPLVELARSLSAAGDLRSRARWGPLAVVVVDEDAEHVLEVTAVEDQQPVQASGANRADEAFGDRVRLWGLHRRLDDRMSSLRKTSSKRPLYLLSRSRASLSGRRPHSRR